ncbi:2-amino-4-hydroxy-6-hydroxymethyldihydropteridine diphosphokinase [Wohlfahrtiimonas larvae]|uniref:2-amino-4-hydroxy-6-hydroxymethyldihydropteridine pyrophosphokinase n=1 Tax=Wohlfahrtiimonas larvae TaxID=1157986 RepID=A0ABP9N0T0_9GAMM|nr:2-amino-4-hydroxy-6-hydroxymethyldihydropteridine diphosphokinase [Wohlfahrtiimonas larvae]
MNQLFISYIALGSNLEDPVKHLNEALLEIEALSGTKILDKSQFYRTKPIGPDQPDIINAVIKVATQLAPYDLLYALQKIELDHGRERIIRFGARTLDLDILLFDDVRLDDSELTIPHPRMQDRNFVLIPLKEIAPDLHLAPFGYIDDLIAQNDPEDYVIPLDLEAFGNKS